MGEWMYRFTFSSFPYWLDVSAASRPGRFTPGERAPVTHWIGGWLDPRDGLDDVEKSLDLTGTRNLTSSVVQPVANRYTD
jgi:hypothetical protein